MTIEQTLVQEETNTTHIYLKREGILWVAYERSAYRLHNTLPILLPVKRHRITIKKDLCFVRFPTIRLAEIIGLIKNTTLVIEQQSNEKITLKLPEVPGNNEQQAFTHWKNGLVIPTPAAKPTAAASELTPKQETRHAAKPMVKEAMPTLDDMSNYILQKIKKYPVFKKTPLETMQFVAELQEFLNN